MSKRAADKYLTHDNFDQEDDEEEVRGSFQQASSTVVGNRDIKKAKRRIGGQEATSPAGGAFQSFSGFTNNKPTAAPTFSFGAVANKPFSSLASSAESSSGSNTMQPKSFTASTGASTSTAQSSAAFSFGLTGLSSASAAASRSAGVSLSVLDSKTPVSSSSTKSLATSSTSTLSGYRQELKMLNESVLRWIQQHVQSDPTCILSPIFADYNRYVEELDKKYPVDSDASKPSTGSADSSSKSSDACRGDVVAGLTASPVKASNGSQTLAQVTTTGTSSKTTVSSSASFTAPGQFSFGSNQASSTASLGLFNSSVSSVFNSGTTTTASPFTIGTMKPSSAAAAAPADQLASGDNAATADGEDDEYVPPKPEVVEVKEDDAFYTVKCKLFYKKESTWTERGVGNLFLKPCAGGKTQLLIRADTNLGNILLNVMLTKSIPTSRQGNNNVSLMCVPNPPLNEKCPDDKTPVCMLVRVKTASAADELLEQLNSHKN